MNKLRLRYIFLLLSLMLTTSCDGQGQPKTIVTRHPKLFKTLGTNEYANIHCGLMDKAGNLWFGTTGEGVYRYDGKFFTNFTEKDGLCNNIVWSILEDRAGNIWFGTDAGLSRYDGKSMAIIPIVVERQSYFPGTGSAGASLSTSNAVWSMLQDKSGKLWFGTKEGVYCYNGQTFTRFLDNNSIANAGDLQLKMVDCLLEDKNGVIWLGSGMPPGEEGICRFDGKSITSFKPEGNGWIRTIVEDKKGVIWLSTRSRGNWRYDGHNFTKFTNKEGIGNPLIVDRTGSIWFSGGENENGYGGGGGIWRYDPSASPTAASKSFKNFTTKDGLGDYSAWCMVEDRDGNIWVGTRNIGLYRFDGKTFTNFSAPAGVK